MTKPELEVLLKEIAGGQTIIGEEAADSRSECELQVTDQILNKFWSPITIGDAIHQLYKDVLRYAGDRLANASPLVSWFFQWHVLSSSRYFFAFDLFKRGYYFEPSSLARTFSLKTYPRRLTTASNPQRDPSPQGTHREQQLSFTIELLVEAA